MALAGSVESGQTLTKPQRRGGLPGFNGFCSGFRVVVRAVRPTFFNGRITIPQNVRYPRRKACPMNSRSLRALAFAMFTGASLCQAGVIDYRGSNVPRNNHGDAFWMYFLVSEHDSTRAISSTDIVVGERIVVTPDFTGQYSTTVGKTILVPNFLKPGNGLYLTIVIPGGDTIVDRRLRVVERTEDCQSIWSLDGVGALVKAGGSIATEPTLTATEIASQKTSTTNDPSLGLASISGLGGLLGGSPAPVVAAPATAASAPATTTTTITLGQAAAQIGVSQVGTSKTCLDAGMVAETRLGSNPVATIGGIAAGGSNLLIVSGDPLAGGIAQADPNGPLLTLQQQQPMQASNSSPDRSTSRDVDMEAEMLAWQQSLQTSDRLPGLSGPVNAIVQPLNP
jgi:hypothetical protein